MATTAAAVSVAEARSDLAELLKRSLRGGKAQAKQGAREAANDDAPAPRRSAAAAKRSSHARTSAPAKRPASSRAAAKEESKSRPVARKRA